MTVVDASEVLRWFVTWPGHEQARTWRERLVDDPDLLVRVSQQTRMGGYDAI